jgi:hypothetical protein
MEYLHSLNLDTALVFLRIRKKLQYLIHVLSGAIQHSHQITRDTASQKRTSLYCDRLDIQKNTNFIAHLQT